MSQLPRLIRGRFGPITFDDMNAVFRHVERDANEEDDVALDDQEQRSSTFFAEVTDLQDHPTAPLGNILAWDELALTDELILKVFENGRSSTQGEDDFTHPAIVLEPLTGLIHVATDAMGRNRYVFQAAKDVYSAKITQVNGGPFNATYSVKSVDGVIESLDKTPKDRWSGINYHALSIGAEVFLSLSLSTAGLGGAGPPQTGPFAPTRVLKISLVAFEQPDIQDCNQGAAAGSGFSDSFIGF